MSCAIREQPLVSICVPTYNAEKTVMQTVRSILSQTYRRMEVIVVDNASEDNTLSLLREIDDPRMKIHCNEINIGAEKNFSKCVQLAEGEYIALFHADDLYLPEMVEKQVGAFQENPAVAAVFTRANFINSTGETMGESKLPVESRAKGVYCFPEIFLSILENLNFLVCPSAMVKADLYKELMPFDVKTFGTSADLDMWFRILERHPIAILDEKLMSYRFSNSQGSYQFAYLRTERADFFEVMEYYLSAKAGDLRMPLRILSKYEVLKNVDRIRCAKNYLLKGYPLEAKNLLKESFSVKTFWGASGATGDMGAHQVLAYWLFAIVGLALLNLGLGRSLGKSLHWLISRRERKFV